VNTGTFVRDHVLGKRSVPLPAVGPSFRLLAVYKKTLPAFIAVPATLDMIDNDPVACFKISNTFAYGYYLATGLMAGDDIVVTRSPGFIGMLVINEFKITAAQTCRFHFQEDLPVSWSGHIKFTRDNSFSTGQLHSNHFLRDTIAHFSISSVPLFNHYPPGLPKTAMCYIP
jgi:hypothetical protein